MKTKVLLLAAAVFASILVGCGGGNGSTGTVVTPVFTDIPSDRTTDAYVAENLNTFALSSPVVGSGALRVGIDPTIPGPLGTEYRAFIEFPLGGAGGVPANATIVSATLDVVVNSVQFSSPVPVRIDLIDVTTPFVSNDYDLTILPPVSTLAPSLSGFNVTASGRYLVDVTPLMQNAQTLAFPSLQLRLLLPLTPGAQGLITIDDSNISVQPFLTVEYL